MVNETKNRGWWIPGGAVDAGETFSVAAKRECLEEAGIDIELKGLLGIDYRLFNEAGFKMRVIFYAEPIDADQVPKQVEDSESVEARYVTLNEFPQLGKIRGDELLIFGKKVEEGRISPMDLLDEAG